jgi:lysine-N-methylase
MNHDIIHFGITFWERYIMTTYWPDYCRDFRCKGSGCIHTCCAGWIIGIDEDSLKRFEKDPDVADKISDGCFVMREDGRCPFLRDDNLCEMIISHGEDYLCDICREHPRFYNEYEDHVEAGMGLVCEEACRLVLEAEEVFKLVADDGSEMELPGYVKKVFETDKPLSDRLREISGGKRAASKLRAEIFDGMEVLDPKWSKLLGKIIEEPVDEADADAVINRYDKEFSNFTAYLLYRYKGAGRFAAEACCLLADLVVKGCGIQEVARVFSCEVEYSDINIDEALETFK